MKVSLRFLGALFFGASLLASTGAAQIQCSYQERNGIIIVEFESLALTGDWVEENALGGQLGDSYIRWNGPDNVGGPSGGILNVSIQLHTTALRQISIRNRHENPIDTEDNDVWFRVAGGTWTKVSSSGPGTVGQWNWVTTDDEGGPDIILDLEQGQHRLQFAGLATDFIMDRFHLYTLGHPLANSEFQPESQFCVGTNYCTGAVNSTGSGTLMNAVGSASVMANDLVLRAKPVTSEAVGIFYYGAGSTMDPFGNGFRCVSTGGVGTFRLDVVIADTNGRFEFPMDLTTPSQLTGQILPSATWYFQAWYRDPAAGGANFNLSDGYEILFQP
ncbi:MAG: hypothetical protein E2O39_09725 [Planctomycetota bacterium]|nr:MAG: hypothetical protein E2O39_09725 [Planctomycetota bacterium]